MKVWQDMDEIMKNVIVIGTGKSGIAAAKLLLEKGKSVTLYDDNIELDINGCIHKVIGDNDPDDRICVITGKEKLTSDKLKEFTLAVLSPGVPTDGDVATLLKDAGLKIWGEIELAWQFEKGKVLAITGTNGKTTTTSLLGQIMKAYGKTIVVGNIGTPYTEEVLKSSADSFTVAEISSFQLETTHSFRPIVSAILNITPDHLNRHHTMENYAAAKQDITKKQTGENVCVLNYMDAYTREFAKKCPAKVVFFSSGEKPENGLWYNDGMIFEVKDGEAAGVIAMSETKLLGEHNAENIMAAIAMAESAGVPREMILEAVKAFRAVEHRIEYVKTVDGVDYYNDSKGTNPDAAIKAVKAMVKPVYIIAGGYDKESTYDEWIDCFGGKVKGLVLLGQTAEKIKDCAIKHGFESIDMVQSLDEAVQCCHDKAVSGDAVLLSPACASWGMFKNFEERGDIFKELVNKL